VTLSESPQYQAQVAAYRNQGLSQSEAEHATSIRFAAKIAQGQVIARERETRAELAANLRPVLEAEYGSSVVTDLSDDDVIAYAFAVEDRSADSLAMNQARVGATADEPVWTAPDKPEPKAQAFPGVITDLDQLGSAS
jgi:hypothetical protein